LHSDGCGFGDVVETLSLGAGASGLALIVLLLGSNSWVANSLVKSLEWQQIPAGKLPKADAIVVLGGATKSAFPPRPSCRFE
jgi:uncharacterized SAM-binding protein YcdF (DUF218 family)